MLVPKTRTVMRTLSLKTRSLRTLRTLYKSLIFKLINLLGAAGKQKSHGWVQSFGRKMDFCPDIKLNICYLIIHYLGEYFLHFSSLCP